MNLRKQNSLCTNVAPMQWPTLQEQPHPMHPRKFRKLTECPNAKECTPSLKWEMQNPCTADPILHTNPNAPWSCDGNPKLASCCHNPKRSPSGHNPNLWPAIAIKNPLSHGHNPFARGRSKTFVSRSQPNDPGTQTSRRSPNRPCVDPGKTEH